MARTLANVWRSRCQVLRRRRSARAGAALMLAGAGCTYGVPDLVPLDASGPTAPDGGTVASDAGNGGRDGALPGAPDAPTPADAAGDGPSPTDTGAPPDALTFDAGDASCTPAGITLANAYLFEPTTATAMVTILGAPNAPAAGDVLVGYVALSGDFSSGVPSITPPSGWQLVGQGSSPGGTGSTPQDSALAVFVDVVAPGDTALYAFTLGAAENTVGWVLDYANVDVQHPVDVQAFQAQTAGASMFTGPFLTTTGPNEKLVASYGLSGSYTTALAGPPGFTSRAYAAVSGVESGASWDATQNMPAGVGGYTFAPASPSPSLTGSAVLHLLALRRCE